MRVPRTNLTAEWEVVGEVSPRLKTFPKNVIDSARIIPLGISFSLVLVIVQDGSISISI